MPTLLGDFYCEPDDVTRGVILFDPMLVSGLDGCLPGMDPDFSKGGDYYQKGLSMPSDFDMGCGFAPPPLGFTEFGATAPSALAKSGVQFSDTDILPRVPSDEFFSFRATTLDIHCDRPPLLMNSFLEFLDTQVLNTELKVTTKKYAIKAEVFLDNMKCTLKARAYQQGPSLIAFEIERKSGDTLTFARVYQSAAKYLQQQNFAIVRGMPQEPLGGSLAPPPLPGGAVDIRNYGPLLDMARLTESPELQAESAAALAAASEDPEVCLAQLPEQPPDLVQQPEEAEEREEPEKPRQAERKHPEAQQWRCPAVERCFVYRCTLSPCDHGGECNKKRCCNFCHCLTPQPLRPPARHAASKARRARAQHQQQQQQQQPAL